jgi:hypothetical protein
MGQNDGPLPAERPVFGQGIRFSRVQPDTIILKCGPRDEFPRTAVGRESRIAIVVAVALLALGLMLVYVVISSGTPPFGSTPTASLNGGQAGPQVIVASVVSVDRDIPIGDCSFVLSLGGTSIVLCLYGATWDDNRTTVHDTDGLCDLTYIRAEGHGGVRPGDLVVFKFDDTMRPGEWSLRFMYLPTNNFMAGLSVTVS